MSTVVMHNVVSVDGYIADENDDVGPLFEWYFNGDHSLTAQEMADPEPGGIKVSKVSYDYVRPTWDAHRVDGDRPAPVRHHERLGGEAAGRRARGRGVASAASRTGGTRRRRTTSSTTSRSAVAKAKELAGERTVAVAAGDVGGQALALGLVDEVAMDVVPVVFGSGKQYFGPVDGQHLLEDPDVVIRGDRVLHLRYRVRR